MHIGIAGRQRLGDHVLHVPRGQELALLDVDHPARSGRRRRSGRSGGRGRPGSAARRSPRRPGAHWSISCTSVSTGRPVDLADLGEDRQRLAKPEAAPAARPRCGWPCRRRSCRSARRPAARRSPSAHAPSPGRAARLSIAQGPAMIVSRSALPIRTVARPARRPRRRRSAEWSRRGVSDPAGRLARRDGARRRRAQAALQRLIRLVAEQ